MSPPPDALGRVEPHTPPAAQAIERARANRRRDREARRQARYALARCKRCGATASAYMTGRGITFNLPTEDGLHRCIDAADGRRRRGFISVFDIVEGRS